ncbi:hypothetical protein Q5691_17230 [Microcoleus sp. w1-18aA5]|uniref:hypothetical protein n=1 Tax=unclassified Microcoleus TaxID=2642155 RepID=UPI002FD010AB
MSYRASYNCSKSAIALVRPAGAQTPQTAPAGQAESRLAGSHSTIPFVGVAPVGTGFPSDRFANANGRFAILDFRF